MTDHVAVADDTASELARQLADIAAVLLAPGDMASSVGRIVSYAAATLDSCDAVGLCDAEARDLWPAPLGGPMLALHELQSTTGQGPAPDVLGGIECVYVPDLLDDTRWPGFSPAAAELGLRSALAYRLSAQGETLGALQLFAQLPAAFNAKERAEGLLFATYAGITLSLATLRQAEQVRISHLEGALTSREVIGQAQGILMERERITADQAFGLLRQSSQHLNRKLRAVAQDVVDTGAFPGGPVT